MSYLQRTTTYGPFTEVVKHHSSMFGRNGVRKKKSTPSTEEVEAANRRHTVDWLFKKMVNNFVPVKDSYVTLTLKPEYRKDPDKAHEIWTKKFIPAMRKAYRKEGIELRYIFAVGGYPDAIHFHLVINSYNGKSMNELLSETWPYGYTKSNVPLDRGYDWEALAEYMVSNSYDTYRDPENPFKQIYSCSRNLKAPEIKRKVIRAGEWRKMPRVSKKQEAAGLRIMRDSLVTGTDIYGFGYQRYVLENWKWRAVKKC